jgi:hypothetical protein
VSPAPFPPLIRSLDRSELYGCSACSRKIRVTTTITMKVAAAPTAADFAGDAVEVADRTF